jgi:hypothetical protein
MRVALWITTHSGRSTEAARPKWRRNTSSAGPRIWPKALIAHYGPTLGVTVGAAMRAGFWQPLSVIVMTSSAINRTVITVSIGFWAAERAI